MNQKVTLLHSVYLSHKNGANTVIRLLIESKERFKSNGIDINWLAPEDIKYLPEMGGFRATMRKRISKLIKEWLIELARHFEWAVKKIIYIQEQRSGEIIAKRYLATNPSKDEVVFIHTFFTCYYYLKQRKVNQHVVLVLHTNGEPFKMQRIYYPKLEGSAFYKELLKMEQFVLESVDRIVLVAQKPREIFLNGHPYVDSEKVFSVYNGLKNIPVPSKEEVKKTEPIEICCVASITPRKGQHFIIEALESMERIPNVHFTFVGEGSDRIRLTEIVEKAGLKQYASFVGVSNNVDTFLNKSDIYILPSEDEGLPMAILEAMRASLPIVSTPVGGIPELLTDGYNGVVIHPSVESVHVFLEHIGSYDWALMGKNSRKLFEEYFTVEKMVDEYSKLLKFENNEQNINII